MSTEIDKRVVEMQFNNKDFEKNAQASLTTIEKLKMALNFDGAKGLESLTKAANKVDLSNISKSADAVAVKFSAMQIAGATAIQQLTLSFMNFGKTLWNSSFGQIKSGGMARALKIEQANFQMRALANNMYDVEKEADKINSLLDGMADAIDRSVTGTAYGYDAAASVASQLMASGLTDADKMYEHLRAIAGAAAMTGRDFENIGDIFTKVSSNGRLMTMELRQFAAAGLNMSSVLADYFGTTEQAVNDMVHDGKVSFEEFSDAVYKAFGDMAGKADETFSGVSKNVKAQLSRIGQLFAQPYIKNMIPFLQTVKAKLKEINTALAPIANTFDTAFGMMMESATESLKKLDLFRLNTIFGGIENILGSIFLIARQVKIAFEEVFPKRTLDELHALAVEFNNLTLLLIPGQDTLNGLKELVKLPLIIAKMILKAIKSVLKGLGPIISAVRNLFGAIARFGEVFTSLNSSMLEGINNASLLEVIFKTIGTAIGYVINLVAILVDVLTVVLSGVLNSTTFKNILGFISSVIDMISRGLIVALYLVSSIIGYIFSQLNFENIIKALNYVKSFATKIFGYLKQFLLFIVNMVLGTLNGISSIGEGISVISEYFKKGLGYVKDFFKGITEGEESTEESVNNLLDVLKRIKDRFDHLFEGLTAGKILLVAFGVGVVLLIFSLEKLIHNLAELANHANVAFGVFDILKNGIAKAIQISPMLQVLIGIAVAIGAVTASLITLGKDLTSEELQRSVNALSTFMGLLVVISAIIMAIGKSLPNDLKTMGTVMKGIASFSVGILGLSLALKMLTGLNLDLKTTLTSLGIIHVLMMELLLVILVISNTSQKIDKEKESIKTVSINFIGLSLAILSLVGSFKLLGTVNPEKVLQSIISFTTVMMTFASVLMAAGEAAKKGFSLKVGLGISVMMSSLTSMFITMLVLSLIPFDTIGKSILKMLALMIPLASFLVVLGEVILRGDKLDKARNIEVLKAMTKMIGLFALVMAEMTVLVAILGKMNLAQLAKGLVAVSIMSLLIEKVVSKFITVSDQLFKKFGSNKDGYKNFNASLQNIAKMITSFALIMTAMSVSALMLDKVSIWGILGAVGAFALVLYSLETIVSAAEKTKDAKIGPLLAIAVSTLAIMSAVALIAYTLSGENYQEDTAVFFSVAAALALVLAAFGFMIKSINASDFKRPEVSKTFKSSARNTELIVLALAGMILAIASIGYLYTKLNNKDQMISALVMVGEIIIALIVVFIALGKLAEINKAVDNKQIKDVVAAQSSLFDALGKFILMISAFVLSISASMALLMAVSGGSWTNMIAPFIAIALAVAGLLVAIGKYLIPKLNEAGNNSTRKEDFVDKFKAMADTVDSIVYGVLAMIASVAAFATLATVLNVSWYTQLLSCLPLIASMAGIIISIMLIFEKVKRINNADKIKTINETFNTVANFMKNLGIVLAIIIAGMAGLTIAAHYGGFGATITGVLSILGAMLTLFGVVYLFAKKISVGEADTLSSLVPFLLALSGSIAILGATLAALALVFNNISLDAMTGSISGFVAIVAAMGAAVVAITKWVKPNDVPTLLAASGAVAIMSASMIAIAYSIRMLYNAIAGDRSATNEEKLTRLSKVFWKVMLAFGLMIGATVLLTKWVPSGKALDIAMIAVLVTTMAGTVLAIAGAIKMLNGVKLDENTARTFDIAIGILTVMVAAIVGLSENAKFANILSAAATIVAFGLATLSIAAAIKSMCNAFSNIDPGMIDEVKAILTSFIGVISVVSLLAGLLGAATGEYALLGAAFLLSFATAILSFGGTVVLFGIGVKLFAEGVDKLISCIQTINDLNIDSAKIENNIKEGMKGFAKGIWGSIGYIGEAILGIITVIAEVLIGSMGLIITIGSMLLIGLGLGLLAALPGLLEIITGICMIIAEWASDEENTNPISDAGYAIGHTLADGILSAFDGIVMAILERLHLDVLIEKINWVKDQIAKLNGDKTSIERDIAVNNQLYDITGDEKYKKQSEYLEQRYDPNNNPLYYKNLIGFATHLFGIPHFNDTLEILQKYEDATDNINTSTKNTTDAFNRQAEAAKKSGAVSSDAILDTAGAADVLNINMDEATDAINNQAEATGKLSDELAKSPLMGVGLGVGFGGPGLNSLSLASMQMKGLTSETNNLTDAIKDADNATKGLGDTVKDELIDSAKENFSGALVDTVKETAGNTVQQYAPGIAKAAEGLGKIAGINFDGEFAFGVLNGDVSIQEAFGKLAASAASAFNINFSDKVDPASALINGIGSFTGANMSNVKTYAQWEAYGQEMITKNIGTFGGKEINKSISRYRAEGFSSVAEYADAMQKKYGTPLDSILKGISGKTVDDYIEDANEATKKMTSGLQDLGETEDEVAKKTDALADSVSNALDIFSEFNDTAEMTGHDVLKSFMSQITGVSKWSTELKALAGKGFSQALLEDLANLGPQGYEKVHALYTMSAKEMSLFNKMYEKKLSLESTTAKDILASFEGNVADIAEVYSEELTDQMQQVTPTLMQVVGGGIVSEMAAIPEQAGTAIGEAAFPLTNAFAELGMSSIEAFKKQLDFEEALEAVKVFQAGIINSTTLGSKLFDELSESEEISSKKMLDNMKRQVMNVGEWVSEINTLVARGASEGLVNQLMEMGPEGKAKVDAFVKMTDSELKEANRLYEASAKLPQVSADRITKSYAQAGYNASLGFTEGIDPEAAQNAMYMLAEHSLEYLEAALDINSPSKKTMEIGVYTVEGFIAGIINEISKYKLRNACASITTIIKDSFKNNLSATTFRSIADDCMAGLANGIMASATDAAIKAAEAAKKVTEAVKNAFDTHSPSLIFKWIGQMLMLGLGDGIVEQGDTTAETAALTAKNVIDNVMTKLASMSEYDEQAYTPVIRPVVDMSNVDQGYNDIRSWFDQQGSISMMGNIRLNTNNENGSSDVNRIVDAINNINNQDVVDEIASLRNDISTLQDSMSRLQVVMDTGSLVGQLVQPMDQALGVRAVTNSRGRYS